MATLNLPMPTTPIITTVMGQQIMTVEWQQFFIDLVNRAGGSQNISSNSDIEQAIATDAYSTRPAFPSNWSDVEGLTYYGY